MCVDTIPIFCSLFKENLGREITCVYILLSPSSLPPTPKMDEFRGLVEEQYYDWVAQYLVMKRASIEPNFHNLYMSFLNSLNSGVLRKSVLSETFRNIRVSMTYSPLLPILQSICHTCSLLLLSSVFFNWFSKFNICHTKKDYAVRPGA